MKRIFQFTIVAVAVGLLPSGCRTRIQSPAVAETPAPAPAATTSPTPLAEATPPREQEPALLPGPNAIPRDTRIVVNIPAFRMDVFHDGTLMKSYKIGIGYQQFPLPTGFRKAEMIVFNPTWTQPNESWASNPGLIVPAGSKGNPLGPIKIPIGGANLIHGGKELVKIGTFASHGCVGLTNDQVKDFAKVLAEASNTQLTEDTMAAFLKKRTRTEVVKLGKTVPVELRYETIVIEDGQLHIYRDVYDQDTNTEENLRAVLEASGVRLDDLTEDERTQTLNALAQMSGASTAKATPLTKEGPITNQSASASPSPSEKKSRATKTLPRTAKNQKEIVIEIATFGVTVLDGEEAVRERAGQFRDAAVRHLPG